MASSDPTAGLSSWRRVADQDDFDGLPAVMKTDGLNGGGIWDIIEYNGSMYVTVVTDKSIDGHINKQGFAMYRGDKHEDGSFTWTQVIGDHGTSGYDFGLGINYSMSCNMWVYNGYLYLGTYNDPMLDLAEIPASGNFELLYNDLDHSIYLYRMDADGNFQQVAGKDDNPYFPDGPIGNLGAGLGNNSNQYIWRYGEHNGELYIGTYDTSTLTYHFTQITDGQVANMDYADISGRADMLKDAVLEVLQQHDNKYLTWFLDKVLFTKYTAHLYQMLAGFATDMSADKNPVPGYRNMLEEYEAFKQKVFDLLGVKLDSASFAQEYAQVTGVAMCSADTQGLKDDLQDAVKAIFAALDKAVYDDTIHNFVYYFGCNYYAQQCENGFDLLVSKDGVNFDAITRDGFGDGSNHGLRTICSTENGVYMGTANPFYGTQLWRMYSAEDKPLVKEHTHQWSDTWSSDGVNHWHDCLADGCTVTDNSQKDGFGAHDYVNGVCSVCGAKGAEAAPEFDDVKPEAFYFDAVQWAVKNGITNGTGKSTFSPNDVCSRYQIVMFLWRAAGQPEAKAAVSFADVKPGDIFYEAVQWAVERGITNGTSSTSFSPFAPCTRGQIVTFLYRSAGSPAISGTCDFSDVSAGSFCHDAVIWASSEGITKGTSAGRFSPNEGCTRAQVVTFLYRASGGK